MKWKYPALIMWQADKNWQNLSSSNPKPDLHNINTYQIWWKSTDIYSSYHPEMKIQTCGRQIILSKNDKNCPIAIPNHNINAHTKFGENPLIFTRVSFWNKNTDVFTIPNHSPLIYTCTKNLNKICQKLFRLESRNQALTETLSDWRRDGHSKGKT